MTTQGHMNSLDQSMTCDVDERQTTVFLENETSEATALKIIFNIENKLYTIGVFLHFKTVFNFIKHDILLQKLNEYGIRRTTLSPVKRFSTN